MNNDFIVYAENLTKKFNDFTAVDSIDFFVKKGESLGILGPNGAGKTTTVKMVSCFMPPTSGILDVFQMSAYKYPRQIKSRLGICQQEDNLDPDLNVYQNLFVYSRYFDIKKDAAEKRINRLLEFVGLYNKRKNYIREISGGMKRRLMIARSLINEPEFLILDEPTTGLDPQARNQVWDSLMELKKRGTGFILTTHYMDEAEKLCERLIIMDQAKIIIEGRPYQLIRKYIGKYVIEISGISDELETFLEHKNVNFEKTSSRILIFTDNAESFFSEVKEKFCGSLCSLRLANLEDVFLKLTGRELRD
ncbi:MAG: ABC transporter ATP-binding protein [Candidatus Omnitrophica bacterium]|nr:ABC transporter ATP-binding protein [Candidatus Omnitrophota bacterium]